MAVADLEDPPEAARDVAEDARDLVRPLAGLLEEGGERARLAARLSGISEALGELADVVAETEHRRPRRDPDMAERVGDVAGGGAELVEDGNVPRADLSEVAAPLGGAERLARLRRHVAEGLGGRADQPLDDRQVLHGLVEALTEPGEKPLLRRLLQAPNGRLDLLEVPRELLGGGRELLEGLAFGVQLLVQAAHRFGEPAGSQAPHTRALRHRTHCGREGDEQARERREGRYEPRGAGCGGAERLGGDAGAGRDQRPAHEPEAVAEHLEALVDPDDRAVQALDPGLGLTGAVAESRQVGAGLAQEAAQSVAALDAHVRVGGDVGLAELVELLADAGDPCRAPLASTSTRPRIPLEMRSRRPSHERWKPWTPA